MQDPFANRAEEIGFDPARLAEAFALVQRLVDTDVWPAAGLCVGRRGRLLPPLLVGRQRPATGSPLLCRDALFLVASITKPVLTAAGLQLVERGRLTLQDRVIDHIPEFVGPGKDDVRLFHLMTHTSGLTAVLPCNHALRQAHEPFASFVRDVCHLPLLDSPGAVVRYQSMGMILLAEVIQRTAGMPVGEFLQSQFFAPLGMRDTFLGCPPEVQERFASIRVQPELQEADWFWNSPYWLSFGAPWGGLVTTPADLGRFCLLMLGGGSLGGTRVLHSASVRAMTMNQLQTLPDIVEPERRCRPWGLGWRLHWPGQPSSFGDLLGPRTFGHWAATGCLCWADPDTETVFVLLTTEPLERKHRLFARVSNMVAAAAW
jgi:CubicO group peptidase (beta-lactamase class C family)